MDADELHQIDIVAEFARRADERCTKLRRQLDEVETFTAALQVGAWPSSGCCSGAGQRPNRPRT